MWHANKRLVRLSACFSSSHFPRKPNKKWKTEWQEPPPWHVSPEGDEKQKSLQTAQLSNEVSSISANWQILHCFVSLPLRTRVPRDRILREATGSRVKQMPYECLYKEMCCPEALPRKPEQMAWVRRAGWRAARRWQPPLPPRLLVGLVHQGAGTFPRGMLAGLLTRWHLIQYWSFYSCSCGPAYSGESGLALPARAASVAAERELRGEGQREQTDNMPLGFTSDDWCVQWGIGGEHSVASQLFMPPISFTCDPVRPCGTSGDLAPISSCVAFTQPDGSAWNSSARSRVTRPWGGQGRANCQHAGGLNKVRSLLWAGHRLKGMFWSTRDRSPKAKNATLLISNAETYKTDCLKSFKAAFFCYPVYFKYTPGYLQIDLKTSWMR